MRGESDHRMRIGHVQRRDAHVHRHLHDRRRLLARERLRRPLRRVSLHTIDQLRTWIRLRHPPILWVRERFGLWRWSHVRSNDRRLYLTAIDDCYVPAVPQ